MARGSSGEVRSHLHLALDLGYIEKEKGEALIEDFKNLSRMISNFMAYLKNSNMKGVKYKKPLPN